MPDPITITPDPVELPRYVIYRLSDRVLEGGSGEPVRPEAIPPELYQALERALDGEPWRESLARRLREQPYRRP